MKSPRNLTERLYLCISGYTYDNIFDENAYNACERLLTDSDFYLKKIHGIQEPSIYTSDDSAQAYKELNKQHVSIGKWLRENIDDFSTFKLSDVADDDVDEIPVSMARKPQYAKGLLFWCDEEGRPVYVSHNNTIIMYCIYKSRLQQDTIYTPIRADYPDMTDVL